MGNVWNSRLKRSKPLLHKCKKVSSGRNYGINPEETKPLKFRSIKKISDETAIKSKIYSKIRIIFLRFFPLCTAKLDGCTHFATEIHHMRGRGIYLLIIKYFMSVCRNCHDLIGVSSEESIIKGNSFRRNSPEEHRYLQPYSADTIRILLESGQKIMVISVNS